MVRQPIEHEAKNDPPCPRRLPERPLRIAHRLSGADDPPQHMTFTLRGACFVVLPRLPSVPSCGSGRSAKSQLSHILIPISHMVQYPVAIRDHL
jgi:hypothetical protein